MDQSRINFSPTKLLLQEHCWRGNPWQLEVQGTQGPSSALGSCEKCHLQHISQGKLGHDFGEAEPDSGQGAFRPGCPHPETM